MEISENLVDLRSHVLSIDLESTHVKDFRNLDGVRANVVVVYDPLTSKAWKFVREEALHLPETYSIERDLKPLLEQWFMQGRRLGGQNILGFDFPVLMQDDSLQVKTILQHFIDTRSFIDTAQYMKNKLGFRVSLKHMVRSTLGDDKTMDGADAPQEWLDGNYEKVVEYCEHDTFLWSNLHTVGVTSKTILLGGAAIPVDW
tara:strand:- start:21037 stop:21639 length:603 start_codon:yes stop_codon:yes gene_type:complete